MKHRVLFALVALLCAIVAFSPCAMAKDEDKKEQLTPEQLLLLWQQKHPQQATPGPQRRPPLTNKGSGNQNQDGNESADTQAFMNIHNTARAAVNVPPLRWSANCAAIAQRWADRLAAMGGGLSHSQTPGYGENIFGGGGSAFTPSDAATSWLSERRSYRGQAISSENVGNVGHYTQMVWRATKEVGYGIARSRSGKTYIVGVYQPSGNFLGEKPY